MSAVIQTITPFIDQEILCEALNAVGCGFKIQNNKIITDRMDLRIGYQTFEKDSLGRYILLAYSHTDKPQTEFIQQVEKEYKTIYQKKLEELELKRLEEERLRLEKERQEFVEKQKQAVMERAKEQGYSVREEKVKGKIKLVLIKNTY